MLQSSFDIIPTLLLEEYTKNIHEVFLNKYQQLQESELSIDTFSFYISVAAVFSSKIEGENIELDSYVKYKRFGVEFLPDYTCKIDDLYKAYQFAGTNSINRENIQQAHTIITSNILSSSKRGKIRTGNMYVTTADGRIEYVAADPFSLKAELNKFFHDLDVLTQTKVSLQQVFYFAALLHLVFVKIHPFDNGNGRISRLMEKWFLARHLGEKAWLIQSERNYYLHHQSYYKNIRSLGLEYASLDYSKALPFLEMLPHSLTLADKIE